MANRLVSNMYIIDSHQLAQPLFYGDSGGTGNSVQNAKMLVTAVIFNPVDTSGRCVIAVGNSANIVMDFKAYGSGAIIQSNAPQVNFFGYPVPWSSVYVPVITAATACLVLG